MSNGVLITLIICLTIFLLVATLLIAGVAISRQKKREDEQGPRLYTYENSWKDKK